MLLAPSHPTPFGVKWLRHRHLHIHIVIRSHSVNISNPPTAAAAAKHPLGQSRRRDVLKGAGLKKCSDTNNYLQNHLIPF